MTLVVCHPVISEVDLAGEPTSCTRDSTSGGSTSGDPTSVGTKGGSGEIGAAQVSYWLVATLTNMSSLIFTESCSISRLIKSKS